MTKQQTSLEDKATSANKIGILTAIINRPRACVSVNQLESPDPGLITQLKGKPTTTA
jgi:hypothetical protein